MARVVVMGAGLGGVACAYEMKKKLGKGHDVTLVGSSAYFEFTPSNPWIMVGWRTAPQTRVDLAQHLSDKGIGFVSKPVESVDAPGSTLRLADGSALPYDYLVITTGPKPARTRGTWNAICLADFGDTGAAFVALPQIPPRNVTWAKEGKWVHLAKVAFEKYFLRKVRTGDVAPLYEKYVLSSLGIESLKS